MENKEDKNEMEPCRRCRKMYHYSSLRIDDDYLEEPVCRHCCGFRNCEQCGKNHSIEKLILDEDNYMVCKMCIQHKMGDCVRCKQIFYEFDLNYVCNGNYACDHCEKKMENEYEDGEPYYTSD